MLGVYLERSEWTALALKRLDENLHRSVMADGSQWEQSPMYHCEVLHNAADALLVARQNKVEVPVRFEENVHKMFRALAAWTKPNGNLPCQSDSDDADARDILAMGALLFEDPVLRTASGADPLEENYWDFGPACGVRLASLEIIADECPSDALPDSGNYMLHCLGDVACELFRAPYSTDYNSLKEGDALLVKCRGEKFTSMVTVLDLAADSPLCAELIPVTRTDGEPLRLPFRRRRSESCGTERKPLCSSATATYRRRWDFCRRAGSPDTEERSYFPMHSRTASCSTGDYREKAPKPLGLRSLFA